MPSVLFICTANICRSPMAEALFADWLKRHNVPGEWRVSSAGTWAANGAPASANAAAVMAERGLDLSQHRSRTVTGDLLAAAGLVLCMTASHAESLRAEFPQHAARIKQMSEIVGMKFDVVDPYGGALVDYQHTAAELADLIERGGRRMVEAARSRR